MSHQVNATFNQVPPAKMEQLKKLAEDKKITAEFHSEHQVTISCKSDEEDELRQFVVAPVETPQS